MSQSARKISHVIPVDGTEHEPVECYCHPEIHETNAVFATMGLEDAGVSEDRAGALSFVHRSASACDEWQIAGEGDAG